jgi:CoA:oxalate CoA-transferase
LNGLLKGIKVLDFTRVLAGPYATMVLADLGAEVIKVELPQTGDEARGFGPFIGGESAYFMSVNRGKKSITLDLRTVQGQQLAQQLAGQCDVLIENFRPGAMDRFGMDYQTLHALYPRLVYASVSGFGQTGPYAQRPAYDVIIQAMGGIASITGHPGQPPVRVGSSIGDLSAALFGVIGILAALTRARGEGVGQQVDISMLDCQVALLENAVARFQVSGEVPTPLGSRHPAITPFQFFAAADGYIVLAAGNDGLWRRLCDTVGMPEWGDDARFVSNAVRTENHAELEALLGEVLRQRSVSDWCEVLGAVGIPCGPILDVGQVVADPQIQARQMIIRLGDLAMPNSPFRFSETPVELHEPAPTLGQDTAAILEGLGYDLQQQEQWRREGVI